MVAAKLRGAPAQRANGDEKLVGEEGLVVRLELLAAGYELGWAPFFLESASRASVVSTSRGRGRGEEKRESRQEKGPKTRVGAVGGSRYVLLAAKQKEEAKKKGNRDGDVSRPCLLTVS